MRKRLVFIVGPTASGKTDLAVKIGQTVNSQLINADSRQVYKRLDIISGKDITPNSQFFDLSEKFSFKTYSIGYYLLQEIPLYLLDVVEPTYEFSVHDYVKLAPTVIEYVEKQNSVPIIVGGSGFYIKALLDGIETVDIPQNKELRESLDKLSVEELQELLKQENREKLDKMNNSDRNNKRRLVRAIEISKHVGVQPLEGVEPLIHYEKLVIGLAGDREFIKSRIDARVEKRVEQGALKEAEGLFKNYESLSDQVKTGSGYQGLFEYLNGNCSLEQAIQNWKYAEYSIAKKQMTWFKKDDRIQWINIQEDDFDNQTISLIKNFLKQK